MDRQIDAAAALIHSRQRAKPGKRYLVAIAGAPGSGKTTIAAALAHTLRSLLQQQPPSTARAVVTVPMDGFHLPRAALDAMPNRAEAYERRGAPWTFDAAAALALVRRLAAWAAASSPRDDEAEESIYAPGFDHAAKDPAADAVEVPADAAVVILEGLYLLLDEPGWADIGPLVDLRILVTVELDEARRRVARRHVEAGIEPTLEDALRRVDANDRLNAQLIYSRSTAADLVIESLPAG
ncbi:hypothetical protein MBLNU459_g1173t1 [Dothideomycetes sp. NU459]